MDNSPTTSTQHKKKKGKKVRFGPLTGILRSRTPPKSCISSTEPSPRRYSADDGTHRVYTQSTTKTMGRTLAQTQREVFSDDENARHHSVHNMVKIPNQVIKLNEESVRD